MGVWFLFFLTKHSPTHPPHTNTATPPRCRPLPRPSTPALPGPRAAAARRRLGRAPARRGGARRGAGASRGAAVCAPAPRGLRHPQRAHV